VGSSQPDQPRRTGLLAATALALLFADLVTKVVAVEALHGRSVRTLGGLVYLTEARNSGAAFSFAEGATVLFTAVAAIVVTVIVRTASRLRSVPWAVCLGLILGGAGGNLLDRLFRSPGPLRGAVVDWISLLDPYGRVWPIFNLADAGIVCGGILAVLLATLGFELDGSRHRSRDRPAREGADAEVPDGRGAPPGGRPDREPVPGAPAASPAGAVGGPPADGADSGAAGAPDGRLAGVGGAPPAGASAGSPADGRVVAGLPADGPVSAGRDDSGRDEPGQEEPGRDDLGRDELGRDDPRREEPGS
jgi:signal peptidase II